MPIRATGCAKSAAHLQRRCPTENRKGSCRNRLARNRSRVQFPPTFLTTTFVGPYLLPSSTARPSNSQREVHLKTIEKHSRVLPCTWSCTCWDARLLSASLSIRHLVPINRHARHQSLDLPPGNRLDTGASPFDESGRQTPRELLRLRIVFSKCASRLSL
jgi:hypothetical protein